MATLEVHDDQGRVQFIELARDHPVLFGTSASCDVILGGDGIRPVHGRIRWKQRRFRIEASPDAEFVLINGTKMSASTLRQGDEITIGDCRMFLLRQAETLDDIKPPPHAIDEGKTRVVPAPVVPIDSPRSDSTGRRRSGHSRSRSDSPLEADDWLGALRQDHRPERAPESAPVERLKRGRADRAAAEALAAPALQPQVKPRRGLPEFLRRLKASIGPQAPGQERIASSPLVLSLVAALAILVAMGFWLKSIIVSTIATRTFNNAIQNFNDGDYRTAIRDFDTFLKNNSDDERTGKARVMRALANVRQYVSTEGATWSSALEASKEMLDQVGGVDEFRDARVDLAELIIRAGEGLADRARHTADAKALAEAESAVPLHAQVAGEPALAFLNKSRLPAKLSEARAAVRKAQIRAKAFAAMDRALSDGSASRVYDARDALVDQYADLAQDRDVITRMTAANELIRRAVSVDKTRRPAEHAPRRDPLGPPTSLVLRSSRTAASHSPAAESIVFALADGCAYALDGTNGAPLWHVPLGAASSYVPRAVAGDATVLACDGRYNELVRLDARTGALKWRLALGEPVADPALVLGNQLIQVLPSGKVCVIALESGELQATVNLGRPLARTPVHDESGEHLYVLGRQDCVFVLARDPLSCVAVNYLGHPDGSIPFAPVLLGQFLIVPENHSLDDGRWQVLVVDEDGVKLKLVQEIPISGWTWSVPASAGSIVWATGDKGGYEAFAVGDYGGKTPFRSMARLTADARSSGPAFALARSDRELWVASGHAGRFELDAERGKIEPKAPLAQPGPALAPIQTAGTLIVMTFQDQETSGVALWGIDPETGSVAWKTIVGAPWPTPLAVSGGSGDISLVARDGRGVAISAAEIAHGGFVAEAIPRPGEFTLPVGLRLRLEISGKPASAIVPGDKPNYFWVQDPAEPGAWRKVGLPTQPAADPIAWGGSVLIPGRDSRAYLIDPMTAGSRAEPFVPKFNRDHQGTWLSPVRLDDASVVLADDVGRVFRVALTKVPVARLVGEAQSLLDQHIIADPASTGHAVIVATADRRVRALAARDLSPVGSWALDAPLAGPPAGVGETGFVMDRAGGVMAFSREGQRIWSINLDAAVIGAPVVDDRSVWLLTEDGKLHVRELSSGKERVRLAVGALPSDGLLLAGTQPVIPTGRGTLRPLVAQPAPKNRP
jgi:outer membrane protein assembly factor BamB